MTKAQDHHAERDKFVATMTPLFPQWAFGDDGTGGFHNHQTEAAWIAWQQRAALPAEDSHHALKALLSAVDTFLGTFNETATPDQQKALADAADAARASLTAHAKPATDAQLDAFIELHLRSYWQYGAVEQDRLRALCRASFALSVEPVALTDSPEVSALEHLNRAFKQRKLRGRTTILEAAAQAANIMLEDATILEHRATPTPAPAEAVSPGAAGEVVLPEPAGWVTNWKEFKRSGSGCIYASMWRPDGKPHPWDVPLFTADQMRALAAPSQPAPMVESTTSEVLGDAQFIKTLQQLARDGHDGTVLNMLRAAPAPQGGQDDR